MCRSGCATQNHQTWGECARAARLQIDQHSLKVDLRQERSKDKRLDRYASLRGYGIQPKNTQWKHVRDAEERGGVAPSKVGATTPEQARDALRWKGEEAA